MSLIEMGEMSRERREAVKDFNRNSEVETSTGGAKEGSPRREPWEERRNNKPRQGR